MRCPWLGTLKLSESTVALKPHPDTRAHLNPWISPLFRVIPALKGNEFLSKIMLVWRIKYTVSALDQDFSYLAQLK